MLYYSDEDFGRQTEKSNAHLVTIATDFVIGGG
jgi:hypothetical protein